MNNITNWRPGSRTDDWQKVIAELRIITQLSAAEIISTVQALPCSFQYAKDFWAALGRFPTSSECRLPVDFHVKLRYPPVSYRDLMQRLVFDRVKSRYAKAVE